MKTLPSAERIREVLFYNPNDGSFVWKERFPTTTISHISGSVHQVRVWNARFMGKCATHQRDGRHYICIDSQRYEASRIAYVYMTGNQPIAYIDHEDVNPLNNKWSNLREATLSQNAANSRGRNALSGLKGVPKSPGNNWRARIQDNHLGTFATPEEAHAEYRKAAKEIFGDFARHK